VGRAGGRNRGWWAGAWRKWAGQGKMAQAQASFILFHLVFLFQISNIQFKFESLFEFFLISTLKDSSNVKGNVFFSLLFNYGGNKWLYYNFCFIFSIYQLRSN
jgi:hypothetical protein